MEIKDIVIGYTQINIGTTYLHALKAISFCKALQIYPLYTVVKNLKLDYPLPRNEHMSMSIMPMKFLIQNSDAHHIL